MKEYSNYQMEDIYLLLSKRGINWDGKIKDYIASDNGNLLYTEVDATIESLKNGYINEHIADKRFQWLEVTSDSFNFSFKGNVYDDSKAWVEYLVHKYPDYEGYSRKYFERCEKNLIAKLSFQKDKSSTISSIIKNQLKELKEKIVTLDSLTGGFTVDN